MLQWTWECRYLSEILFLFSIDVYSEVRLVEGSIIFQPLLISKSFWGYTINYSLFENIQHLNQNYCICLREYSQNDNKNTPVNTMVPEGVSTGRLPGASFPWHINFHKPPAVGKSFNKHWTTVFMDQVCLGLPVNPQMNGVTTDSVGNKAEKHRIISTRRVLWEEKKDVKLCLGSQNYSHRKENMSDKRWEWFKFNGEKWGRQA